MVECLRHRLHMFLAEIQLLGKDLLKWIKPPSTNRVVGDYSKSKVVSKKLKQFLKSYKSSSFPSCKWYYWFCLFSPLLFTDLHQFHRTVWSVKIILVSCFELSTNKVLAQVQFGLIVSAWFSAKEEICHFRRRQTADMTGYVQVTVITGTAPYLYLLHSLPLHNITLGSAFRTSLVRLICQHNWDLLPNFPIHKGFQMCDFSEITEGKVFSIHKFKQSSLFNH